MPFANNGEVQLYWRQDGSDSKPPLLLHPILTDHGVWDRVVPLLTDHFRIIRMDLRGQGASSGTPYASQGHRITDLVQGASECRVPGGFLACLESPGAFVTSIGRFFDRLRREGLGLDPARNGDGLKTGSKAPQPGRELINGRYRHGG